LFLWSVPRARSTAFERMMSERGDFLVVHEPFSALVVEGRVRVGGEVVTGYAQLVAALHALAADRNVFVKETTEYRYDVVDNPDLFALATHTFMIRDPVETIASFYAMDPNMQCGDVGFESLFEIL
jgi:Sulfotransferase domain